ncbi:MAG: transglutaminase domain-containing protein, partial [Actinobacteria bacterium]|nr:transglutaminase domain-containing protein [Actinomycetota bacterium]
MGSETRARLGLAGLLLVTLFSFEQLFFSSDYSGPSLLAAILAALLAAGARRLGAGIALTTLASVAGLVVYLSLVFEADATLFGLPTYDAVTRLWDAVTRAVSLSEIDFAPIPSRPGYVILVVAGMWIAAAVGEVAAFRWRRPLLASLPALVLFGYAVIVGSGTGTTLMVLIFLIGLLTFWGLESSHRISSWGRWIPTFEGKAVEPSSVSGRVGRRMGASCIACALVVPILVPAFSDGFSWRSGMGTGPGSGSGGVGGGDINLLVSLVPNRLRQSPQKLFEVASEEEAYWRLVSLDQFDGETWQPPAEASVSASAGFVANTEVLERPTDRRVVQEFRLEGLRGDYLPAAAEPVGLEFPAGDLSLGDVALSPSHQDIQLEGGIQDDLTYTVESLAPDPSYGELNASVPGIPGQAPARVAQSLTAPVEALRDRWIAGATTDFENLVAIQSQLRKFDYDIDVEDQSSADYLETFLTDTRAGYCQQFATAFALLSRSLGYPTRVSVGFLPGERDDNGDFQVTGEDAHAWPEVYFGTYGWVPFEPTPRPGLAQPPDYTNIPQGTGQGEGSGRLGG